MSRPPIPLVSGPPASLWRRLGAMGYDALLVLALWMFTTYPLAVVVDLADSAWLERLFLLPDGRLGGLPFRLLLIVEAFAFFAYCWTRSGQTLGMQAWRIRIENVDGSRIDLWQALTRFLVAVPAFGFALAGYLWMYADPWRMTWTDRFSGSVVRRLVAPAAGDGPVASPSAGPAQQYPGDGADQQRGTERREHR